MGVRVPLSSFFNDADTITVGGASVRAHFSKDYVDAMGTVASNTPLITCQTADVASASLGTAVTANATSYVVAERRDDGFGFTELFLELA